MRFFGKNAVAGLYAGRGCAAVAEALSEGGAWRLTRFVKAPMPDGAPFSGLRDLLPELLSLSGIKARDMTVGISDSAAKTFLLDDAPGGRRGIMERIRSSAFGISVERDRIEYQRLSRDGSGKALVSAVPEDFVASIEGALAEKGLRAVRISPASFNMANLISSRTKALPRDFSIIAIHGDYFAAHFFSNGALDFYWRGRLEGHSEAVQGLRAAFVHYMGTRQGWKAGKVFLLGGRGVVSAALSEWFGHAFEAVDAGAFLKDGGVALDQHDALTALSALA